MLHAKSSIYFLLLCLAIAFAAGYFVVKPFLGPLILAAVFSFLFQSLYSRLLRFKRKKEGLAALATMIIAIVLFLSSLIIFILKYKDT